MGTGTINHQKLVDDVLFALGSREDVRAWRRDVGAVEDTNGRYVRYGIVGESDIDGIIAPYGIALSVEIKTGTGKMREQQKNWKNMKELFGGIHIEGRSVEQVIQELEEKVKQWKVRTYSGYTRNA